MYSKKYYIPIFILLVYFQTIFAWPNSGPSDVVKEFFENLKNGRLDPAIQLLSVEARLNTNKIFSNLSIDESQFREIELIETKKENIKKNTANCLMSFRLKRMRFPEFMLFELSKEDGKWKIRKIESKKSQSIKVDELLVNNKGAIFIYTAEQLLSSIDNGNTWIKVYHPNTTFTAMSAAPNGDLYAWILGCKHHKNEIITPDYTGSYCLIKSKDNGINWDIISKQKDNLIKIIFDKVGNIYGMSLNQLYKSNDDGNTWELICQIKPPADFDFITVNSNDEPMWAYSSVKYKSTAWSSGAYRSDGHIEMISKEFGRIPVFNNEQSIKKIFTTPNNQVLVQTEKSLFYTENDFNEWKEIPNKIQGNELISIAINDLGEFYALSFKNGFYKLNQLILNWSLLHQENNFFIGHNFNFIFTEDNQIIGYFDDGEPSCSDGVIYSNDQGRTWIQIFSPVEWFLLQKMEID